MSIPQGVYAASLRQGYGYPLRLPRPSSDDDTVGLRIGDVGYVDQNGQFKVLFNICFPPPSINIPPFQPIDAVEKLTSTLHGAINSNLIVSGVRHEQSTESSAIYKFTAYSDKGAILILPSGATLHELQDPPKLDQFRNLAIKHAISWCKHAHQDSLYLITSLYKTTSWTLGSFHQREQQAGDYINVKESSPGRNTGDRVPIYQWTAAFTVDSQSSLKDVEHENQTVLIKGFKMTVNKQYGRVERFDGHQNALISFLMFLLGYLAFRVGMHIEWLPRFTVEHHPALSQPLHYLDIINRYQLEKNSKAKVAIAHDEQWINIWKLHPDMDETEFMGYLESDYVCQSDQDAVYLRSVTEVSRDAQQESEISTLRSISVPEDDQIVIIHMRAENITDGLSRTPVGFFVRVSVKGGMSRRTKNSPTLVHDHVIEWDILIHLPSDPSAMVELVICASFGFSPVLGEGEPIARLVISVHDLLNRTSPFTSSEMKDLLSPSLSLLVSVKECRHNYWMSNQVDKSQQAEGPVSGGVMEATDEGYRALRRYCNDSCGEDLESSIEHFKRALDMCPERNPCRAAALFNLAKAQFLACQRHGTTRDIQHPISLYQDALELRHNGHLDRPVTLLHLCQAHLYDYGIHGHKTSQSDIVCELVDGLKRICHEDSHEHRAADLVLQTFKCSTLGDREDLDELGRLISEMEVAARKIPDVYFDKANRCHNLGLALQRRFQLSGDAPALDQAIEWFEKAKNLTPGGHPDRSKYLSSLADARLVRFRRQCALPLTGEL